MKRGTSKARRLLFVAAILFSVTALSLSNTADAADLCKSCGLQCANEAWYLQQDCYRNGGSNCGDVYNQYVASCKSTFCNYGLGCKF